MGTVQESVDVDVPIGRRTTSGPSSSTSRSSWTGSSRSLRPTTAHPLGDQDRRASREFDAEITEQHPDERVAWTSTGGDTKHAGVVTFHRLADNKTRVTVQLDWEPEGFVEKVGSAVGVDDHQVKADAKRFKEFIESRGAATGAWRGDVERPQP